MFLKNKKVGEKNIFISGVVNTSRINFGPLEKANVMNESFCQKYGWLFYVHNRNIQAKYLYKHDFHLMEKSKIILVGSFILCFNNATSNHFEDYNFLDKHTHHPLIKIWREISPKKQVY